VDEHRERVVPGDMAESVMGLEHLVDGVPKGHGLPGRQLVLGALASPSP